MLPEIKYLKPTIVLCGSMRVLKEMKEVSSCLNKLDFKVVIPEVKTSQPLHPYEEAEITDFERRVIEKTENNYIEEYLQVIRSADAVLVVNPSKEGSENRYPEGYIGGNTFGEMFAARAHTIPVFMMYKPVTTHSYSTELFALRACVGLDALMLYFSQFEKTLVASTSLLKLQGVANSLKLSGKKSKIFGTAVASGVSEQPVGWGEMKQGVLGRLEAIRGILGYHSYVAYEGGLIEENGVYYGASCAGIVKEGRTVFSRSIGLEYPPHMIDMWKSGEYSDLGHVAQALGAPDKNPAFVITAGKYSRLKSIEDAITKCLVQI